MCYAVYAGKNGDKYKRIKECIVRTNGLKHLERSGDGEHAGAAAHPLQSLHGGDDGGGGEAQRAASGEPQHLHYPKEKEPKKKQRKKSR